MSKDNFPVRMVEINKIIPYDSNVKIHDDEQIEKLANNIKKFGFDQPIVVDKDNVIIKGHGRRLACLKLGLDRVPVIVRDDLTKEEADAARLSDNRVTSSEYDIEGLQAELERLSNDFDFKSLGFDERELNFSIDNIDIEGEFVDNIEQAMNEYDEETQEKVAESNTINITKALGFKEIDANSAFDITKFVDMATIKYGAEPNESFCRAIRAMVENGELKWFIRLINLLKLKQNAQIG